jgi:hypothetical protein
VFELIREEHLAAVYKGIIRQNEEERRIAATRQFLQNTLANNSPIGKLFLSIHELL